jgi:hypothetical protein
MGYKVIGLIGDSIGQGFWDEDGYGYGKSVTRSNGRSEKRKIHRSHLRKDLGTETYNIKTKSFKRGRKAGTTKTKKSTYVRSSDGNLTHKSRSKE